MKKTYIQPHAEVVVVATTNMIAASLFSGELGSRLSDFMDGDDALNELSSETGSTLFDDDIIDAETFLGE